MTTLAAITTPVATAGVTPITASIFVNLSKSINDTYDYVLGMTAIWNNPNIYDPGDGGRQEQPLYRAVPSGSKYPQSRTDSSTSPDLTVSVSTDVLANEYNKLANDTDRVSSSSAAMLVASTYAIAGVTAT